MDSIETLQLPVDTKMAVFIQDMVGNFKQGLRLIGAVNDSRASFILASLTSYSHLLRAHLADWHCRLIESLLYVACMLITIRLTINEFDVKLFTRITGV